VHSLLARPRIGMALAIATSVVGLTAPPAAAVTIGQSVDGSNSGCDPALDWVQASVASGNNYTAPGVGTVTSWAMNASEVAGQQLTMKMWRKVGEPATYHAVGHAGPQTLTLGGTNTFPANIPVKPGDILGFHTLTDETRCALNGAPGATVLASATDLADGASNPFTLTAPNALLNITANFEFDNSFTRGKVKRNKNKGTATVTLNLPNPGQLTGSGGGAKVSGVATTSKAVPPGSAKIVIRAKGKKKATLNETGKVTVKPKITYTPTGGDPGTRKLKIKLLKR
jgi:hypothetical protein